VDSFAVETPARKRFTRAEFDRLCELEIFAGPRCELIDGELLDKSGQSPQHAWSICAKCGS
jgi:hypothetical protein